MLHLVFTILWAIGLIGYAYHLFRNQPAPVGASWLKWLMWFSLWGIVALSSYTGGR